MNNVVPIIAKRDAEIALTESEICISTAVTDILGLTRRLGQTVKELSKQFDAIETAVDTIDDTMRRRPREPKLS